MDVRAIATIGYLAATLAAPAFAAEPSASIMEEVIVTAKYPAPQVMEEVVVTAPNPFRPIMEEVIVTEPSRAAWVAADFAAHNALGRSSELRLSFREHVRAALLN